VTFRTLNPKPGTATRYHGMERVAWEIVCHQGRLRPATAGHDGTRVWRIVADRGYCYFTSDPDMAAIYAGGKADRRLPTQPTGRWKLPGGIANQDGVVLACDFTPGELTYTHRPNSHEEYVTDQPVPADRLKVVAFIPSGSNVFDALKHRESPPPLPAADQERIAAIDPDAPLYCSGPLVADLRAAGATENNYAANPWL
jgi:hypothetical protein